MIDRGHRSLWLRANRSFCRAIAGEDLRPHPSFREPGSGYRNGSKAADSVQKIGFWRQFIDERSKRPALVEFTFTRKNAFGAIKKHN
jgi:hypothetical protein